jgi:hypothetical protein
MSKCKLSKKLLFAAYFVLLSFFDYCLAQKIKVTRTSEMLVDFQGILFVISHKLELKQLL